MSKKVLCMQSFSYVCSNSANFFECLGITLNLLIPHQGW